MGLSTSLRHSEILSARFDGLDPCRRRLRVQVKGRRRRDQPLSKELTDILCRESDGAQDLEGWLFPNPASASGHIESMKTAFRRCVIAAGADVRTIQEFSGHLGLAMVMRYTPARDERVDQAIEKMERAKTKAERIAPPGAQDS
ncbi:MAG: tyrosine-type recombinase/integrase [Alphaproteobacteria bacterium]|nr:tyrosine-type recombinase/integrase [Alphaproteobacteria bacterium]